MFHSRTHILGPSQIMHKIKHTFWLKKNVCSKLKTVLSSISGGKRLPDIAIFWITKCSTLIFTLNQGKHVISAVLVHAYKITSFHNQEGHKMKRPTGIPDDYLICTYVEEQAIFADF